MSHPQNLLKNEILQRLYLEAQDSSEQKASAFWQVFMQGEFGIHENFIVVCEIAPTSESRRRIDLTVQYFNNGNATLSTVLLHECKRSKGNIAEVERQVASAADLVIKEKKLDWVYVMMTVGTKFRFALAIKGRPDIVPLPQFADSLRYVDASTPASDYLYSAIRLVKSGIPVAQPTTIIPSNYGSAPMLESSSAYTDTSEASEPLGNIYNTDEVLPTEEEVVQAMYGSLIRVTVSVGVWNSFSTERYNPDVEFFDENGTLVKTKYTEWELRKSSPYLAFVYKNRYYTLASESD